MSALLFRRQLGGMHLHFPNFALPPEAVVGLYLS
jgi:hypothetical protein